MGGEGREGVQRGGNAVVWAWRACVRAGALHANDCASQRATVRCIVPELIGIDPNPPWSSCSLGGWPDDRFANACAHQPWLHHP